MTTRLQMQECIIRLRTNGIRLVCFDFDQTAYRGHTGGALDLPIENMIQTLHEMVCHLSQDFKDLVHELHKENVHVAIVTFGDALYNSISLKNNTIVLGGEPLIRPVLNQGLSKQTSDKIPIYALNPEWRNREDNDRPRFPNSKQWHMSQAMEHFSVHQADHVLLIDDSDHNIAEAASDGFHTVLVSTKTAFEVSQVLTQLVCPSAEIQERG
jgi:hypothetical protein